MRTSTHGYSFWMCFLLKSNQFVQKYQFKHFDQQRNGSHNALIHTKVWQFCRHTCEDREAEMAFVLSSSVIGQAAEKEMCLYKTRSLCLWNQSTQQECDLSARQHTSPDPHTSVKVTDCDLQAAGVRVLMTEDVVWLAIEPCHFPAVHTSYCLQGYTQSEVVRAQHITLPLMRSVRLAGLDAHLAQLTCHTLHPR